MEGGGTGYAVDCIGGDKAAGKDTLCRVAALLSQNVYVSAAKALGPVASAHWAVNAPIRTLPKIFFI